MALIFIDSFSHYDTAHLYSKWTTSNNIFPGFDGASIVAGDGRCLQSALEVQKFSATTVGNGPCLTINPATEWCMGAGFRSVSTVDADFGHGIYRLNTSGLGPLWRQIELLAMSDQTLRLVRLDDPHATTTGDVTELWRSTQTFLVDTWHHIEFLGTISAGAGTAEVWVDGVQWVALAGINTDIQGVGSWNNLQLGVVNPGGGSAGNAIKFSDFYLSNSAADRKGDCRVFARLPTGDGTYTEWTPSSGLLHYAMVDENPPDDGTTTNSAAAINLRDTYTLPAVSIASGTIFAVQVLPMMNKDTPFDLTVAPMIRQAAVDYVGTAQPIAFGNYIYYRQLYETSPAGGAWSVSTANNDEFGVKVIT